MKFKCFLFGVFFLPLLTNAQDESKMQEAFSKSYVFESSSDFAKATTAIKELKVNTYEVNLRLGWLNYLSKEYLASISYYEKAIEFMPYAIEARLGIVNSLAAIESWDKVLEQYNLILKADPQNSLVLYRVGYIHYYRQDYSAAQKYLEKVVNLYPFDYDSTILLAWTKLNSGRALEAKTLFNKVLLMRPLDSSAIEGLKLIK